MADLNNIGAAISAQFRGLNGRHPGQWPLIPRLAVAAGLIAAILAGGWFFYWSEQLDTLEQGGQEEVKLKDAYKVKIAQAVNLEGLREQRKQVAEYVQTLEKQLPSRAEMDALLSDINQAGVGRGLQFELFRPGQVVVKDYYAEQPIEIKVTGNYHDVGDFSGDIAGLPRIVTLNNLSLTSTSANGPLSLDAVAKTFRYLDPEEVAAQRKAAAPKKPGGKP